MGRKKKKEVPNCPKCNEPMKVILIRENGSKTYQAEWRGSKYYPIFNEISTDFLCISCNQVIGTYKADNTAEGFLPELAI